MNIIYKQKMCNRNLKKNYRYNFDLRYSIAIVYFIVSFASAELSVFHHLHFAWANSSLLPVYFFDYPFYFCS